MTTSRRITLASRPTGQVQTTDFGTDEVEVPPLQDGGSSWPSVPVDRPDHQGWMSYDTYLPKIVKGDVIRSAGAGE